jgi:uncharacterized coiled-coil protein SlyX
MKAWNLAIFGVLSALVAGQGLYLWRLRDDVHRLSRRVESLSSQLAQGPAAAPPPQIDVATLRAAVLSSRGTEPAAPEVDQKVRAVVADELKRQRDEDLRQGEARADEAARNTLQAVAQELEAGDLEMARLEELGNALQDAESALSDRSAAGTLSAQKLSEEHHRAWTKMDSDIRSLLGSDRYARFEALRREHPEFARSLHALRGTPETPTAGR